MAFLYLFEALAVGLMLLFVVTQIVAPLLFYRPIFPIFRGWNKARQDISEAIEEKEIAAIRQQLKALRSSADGTRRADVQQRE